MMQMMKKLRLRIMALLLAGALCLPVLSGTALAAPVDDAQNLIDISAILSEMSMDLQNEEYSMLEQMLAELLRRDPALYRQMIDYMFEKLDRYSHFMTAEEYEQSFPRSEPYVGVGFTADDSYPYGLVIDSFVEGGSAIDSELCQGDVVVTVDGVNVELLPYFETVMLIRGEEGTAVTLEVRRGGHDGLIEVTLERKSLLASNITYENMGDGVALITISKFDSLYDTMDFIDIYNSIPYDDDIRSVIIDLRDNPGGDVAVLFNMINYILPDTKALMFTLTTGAEHSNYVTSGAGVWVPNELVILVNENTASCSEMFAGSMQMHDLAEVVGVKTYGKGRSQYHVETIKGDVVVVTAFDILLPDGSTYDGVGITPDYVVEQEYEPFAMPDLPGLDVKRAVKYGTASTRVRALQQRLSLLGIYPCAPNGVFDDMTRWSVNVLQKTLEQELTDDAGPEILAEIQSMITELSESSVVVDKQFEKAMELAAEAAKEPLKQPLKPREATQEVEL